MSLPKPLQSCSWVNEIKIHSNGHKISTQIKTTWLTCLDCGYGHAAEDPRPQPIHILSLVKHILNIEKMVHIHILFFTLYLYCFSLFQFFTFHLLFE